MDIATIIGLVTGTGLLLWAIMSKSPLGAFIDPASFAIVLGGAFASAMISFPMRNLVGVARVVKNCFFAKPKDPRRGGAPAGVLIGYSIFPDGLVTGTFSNQKEQVYGQIALATFTNNEGLIALSQNNFAGAPTCHRFSVPGRSASMSTGSTWLPQEQG